MDCLDNIIGLSETTCECFPDAPADYNTSKSGIFLDQLEGMDLKLVEAADECSKGGLWDRMQKSVRNAQLEFESDFLACLQTTYRQRLPNWSGLMGEPKFTTFLNLTTPYAGIRINTWESKGSFLKIKKIGVLVNASVPVTVEIYSNEGGGTLITSYVINAVANTLTFATITPGPLKLALWNLRTLNLHYYVLLKLDGTFKPLNNKRDCGCGGGNKRPWLAWFDFTGMKGNAPLNNSFNFQNTQEVNGLVLDVETGCEMAQVICGGDEPLDFDNDGYAKKMAYAIRFKAGELLLHDLVSSSNINRFTLLDGERVAKYLDYYRTQYSQWIDFLCANSHLEENCCFVCNNQHGLIKSYIRS